MPYTERNYSKPSNNMVPDLLTCYLIISTQGETEPFEHWPLKTPWSIQRLEPELSWSPPSTYTYKHRCTHIHRGIPFLRTHTSPLHPPPPPCIHSERIRGLKATWKATWCMDCWQVFIAREAAYRKICNPDFRYYLGLKWISGVFKDSLFFFCYCCCCYCKCYLCMSLSQLIPLAQLELKQKAWFLF